MKNKCQNCRWAPSNNGKDYPCGVFLSAIGLSDLAAKGCDPTGSALTYEPMINIGDSVVIREGIDFDFFDNEPGLPTFEWEMDEYTGSLLKVVSSSSTNPVCKEYQLADGTTKLPYAWIEPWLQSHENLNPNRQKQQQPTTKEENTSMIEKVKISNTLNTQKDMTIKAVKVAADVTKGDIGIKAVKSQIRRFCTPATAAFLDTAEGEYVVAQGAAVLLNATTDMHSKPVLAENIAQAMLTAASVKEIQKFDIAGLLEGLAAQMGLVSIPANPGTPDTPDTPEAETAD